MSWLNFTRMRPPLNQVFLLSVSINLSCATGNSISGVAIDVVCRRRCVQCPHKIRGIPVYDHLSRTMPNAFSF